MLAITTLWRLGAKASSMPARICENHGLWLEFTTSPMLPVRPPTRLCAATDGV